MVQIPAALDSVKSGVCEIVVSSTGTFTKDFPLSLVTNLPTMGFYGDSWEDTYKANLAFDDLYAKFPEILNEFKDFKLLQTQDNSSYNLVSKSKEIHFPSDFKGLKVGGAGHVMEIVKANGGAEVHQVPPEAYNNLDKGIVDAAFNLFAQVRVYNLYEVCDYFYTQSFFNGTMIVLMNLDAWNALSPQDQEIMKEIWPEVAIISCQAVFEDCETGKQKVLEAGKKLVNPTPEEAAAWADRHRY